MSATVIAIVFVQLTFGLCDGKKFIVPASISFEGKNTVVLCGTIYTTEGLGYRVRGGESVFIPVDNDNCYTCGPCTYPKGMICSRTYGECLSPSRPAESLEQRLAPGRSIISIDESKPLDEVYTGILDPKTRSNEYRVEAVTPLAYLDPRFFQQLSREQGSGDSSADGSANSFLSGDVKTLFDLGASSGDGSGGNTGLQKKSREGNGIIKRIND